MDNKIKIINCSIALSITLFIEMHQMWRNLKNFKTFSIENWIDSKLNFKANKFLPLIQQKSWNTFYKWYLTCKNWTTFSPEVRTAPIL
jgi:hypothetical protein